MLLLFLSLPPPRLPRPLPWPQRTRVEQTCNPGEHKTSNLSTGRLRDKNPALPVQTACCPVQSSLCRWGASCWTGTRTGSTSWKLCPWSRSPPSCTGGGWTGRYSGNLAWQKRKYNQAMTCRYDRLFFTSFHRKSCLTSQHLHISDVAKVVGHHVPIKTHILSKKAFQIFFRSSFTRRRIRWWARNPRLSSFWRWQMGSSSIS